MCEASDFQSGIITCQLPSTHDSSLLISLEPNTSQAPFDALEIPPTALPGYSDLHYV